MGTSQDKSTAVAAVRDRFFVPTIKHVIVLYTCTKASRNICRANTSPSPVFHACRHIHSGLSYRVPQNRQVLLRRCVIVRALHSPISDMLLLKQPSCEVKQEDGEGFFVQRCRLKNSGREGSKACWQELEKEFLILISESQKSPLRMTDGCVPLPQLQ